MAKRSPSDRELGIRHAIAMLHRLKRNTDLAWSCDPEGEMRNLVFENLESHMAVGDRAWIEGFCLAMSGYLGILGGGSDPEAHYVQRLIERRLAREGAAAQAQADGEFRRFLGFVAPTHDGERPGT